MPDPPAPTPLARFITVTGVGRASVRPDVADLRLGVSVTEPTVEVARSASARAVEAILTGVRAIGVAGDDLQTSLVNVSPQYDYSREAAPPRLVGYQLTNLVVATVRDVARVGDVVDTALRAGATSVDQIAFRVSDPSAPAADARAAAVTDAAANARTLAAAAGVSVGAVVSIVEGAGGDGPPRPFAEVAALKARDATTPIEPGTNAITATVTVTYALEP